jgi:hypothetical protein
LLSYAEFEFRVLAEGLEAMADAITSRGLINVSAAEDIAWPYVTIPIEEFEAHAGHETSLSRNHFVYTSTIVHNVTNWNIFNDAVFSGSNVSYNPYMFSYGNGDKLPTNGTGPFIPVHQVYNENMSVTGNMSSINNFDTSSEPGLAAAFTAVSMARHSVLSRPLSLTFIRDAFPDIFDPSEPLSIFVEPIFSTFKDTSAIVGYVQSLFDWKFFFLNLNADEVKIVCVVENTCGDYFTFIISKDSAVCTNFENARHLIFDGVSATMVVGAGDITGGDFENAEDAGVCIYSLTIYPTKDFRKEYNTNAILYTVVIGLTMISMISAFFAFDT